MKSYIAMILTSTSILGVTVFTSFVPTFAGLVVFFVFFTCTVPFLMHPEACMEIDDMIAKKLKGMNSRERRLRQEAREAAETLAIMRTNREDVRKLELAMLMRWEDQFRRACGHAYQRDINAMDYAVWWDEQNKVVQMSLERIAKKHYLAFLVDGTTHSLPVMKHIDPKWRYYQFMDKCRQVSSWGTNSWGSIHTKDNWAEALYEVEQVMINEGLDPKLPSEDQMRLYAITKG